MLLIAKATMKYTEAPSEARCEKGTLHDYQISRDLPNVLIEVCSKCSKKEIYYKYGGRFDTKKHLRAHLRDTLQPYGRTRDLYLQTYGTKGIRLGERMAGQFIGRKKREEHRQELKEKRISLRKQVFKGQAKSTKEVEEELKRFKYKTTGLQHVSN